MVDDSKLNPFGLPHGRVDAVIDDGSSSCAEFLLDRDEQG
jgi:hypothetical protein